MTSPLPPPDTQWQRPLAVAVDVVAVSIRAGGLTALLIRRNRAPFSGYHCLPGAFVGPTESLEAAARRVMQRRAHLDEVYLEQLYSFGEPTRDPRGRVVTVAYLALVPPQRLASWAAPKDAGFAELEIPWSGETGGPVRAAFGGENIALGFDHAAILGMTIKRLRGKLGYTRIAFAFLPEAFTLRTLRKVHESIAGRTYNKDSFRRTMLASGDLTATGHREDRVGHRPAALYRPTHPFPPLERSLHG